MTDEPSTTCVVVTEIRTEERCGKPVVGERAGFPMCADCMDLFAPDPPHPEHGARP